MGIENHDGYSLIYLSLVPFDFLFFQHLIIDLHFSFSTQTDNVILNR